MALRGSQRHVDDGYDAPNMPLSSQGLTLEASLPGIGMSLPRSTGGIIIWHPVLGSRAHHYPWHWWHGMEYERLPYRMPFTKNIRIIYKNAIDYLKSL